MAKVEAQDRLSLSQQDLIFWHESCALALYVSTRRFGARIIKVVAVAVVATAISGPATAWIANAQSVDLGSYLPNLSKTWFMSLQTNQRLAIRYATNINRIGGQLWWRWQFSAKVNEYYDVMYWDQFGARSQLHYQATYEHCDAYGNNCSESILHPGSVIYAPRFLYGAANGGGTSTALHYHLNQLICSGTDQYTWSVLPIHEELRYLPRIVKGAPQVHIKSVQLLHWTSGPCVDETWAEDQFFGTVMLTGANTLVFTQGGNGPYADDLKHWDLLVFYH